MKKICFPFSVLFLCIFFLNALSAQNTRLLRNPAISSKHIAFVYAGDIWISDLNGERVRRLTTFQGNETDPHFSPDGQILAFSAEYDGNTDVYVLPISGGTPQRLTWHPGPDLVRGWTNNGSRVLFASGRERAPYPIPDQFWTVGMDQQLPTRMKVPRVFDGTYSPDGNRFAYQMISPWESEWRNYRGGQNNPIRIIDLQTMKVEKVDWKDSNDKAPVWIGEEVFFLSDRDLIMNIWAYHTGTKVLRQVTSFKKFDCKGLAGSRTHLVFENEGQLYKMAATDKQPKLLNIKVDGDFPWARPHWEDVSDRISSSGISPSGKRAVFSARGDIFTVPANKGNIRNLTNSPGSAERLPAWSPDGQSISWFSDQSGEYQLCIADQFGKIKKTIKLNSPTYYYTPAWSPDSRSISFGDADRNLWVVEIASGTAQKIDNEGSAHPMRTIYPEWAPDSRWIAYTKRLDNEYNAIFVYSLDQKKSFQITDGMSESHSPAWDKSGKYLYFLASTNYALSVGWLDMSSIRRPLEHSIYLAVLSKSEPSPIAAKSDEEEEKKEEEKSDEEEGKKEEKVVIDFEGLNQRIIALDVPARNYTQLEAGSEGTVLYAEQIPYEQSFNIHSYNLDEQKATKIAGPSTAFQLSFEGDKMLYATPDQQWSIVDASSPVIPGGGQLKLGNMKMKVDPLAESRQMFKEAWRYQRDYFYVENVHGLDLDWAFKTYSPWVEDVRHRSDMTYLLDILSGETAIGHSFVRGGDFPDTDNVPVGLLGADYEAVNGFYRIKKIYTGENWNPDLRAPLSGPGIDVKEGDYLLAVNGIKINANTNLYSYFDQLAGKKIRITVNAQTSMTGAREVDVVPLSGEFRLRQYDWVEGNRRKVDELSGGKLAYVWLPNTGMGGYQNFNRYYFAQKHKKGAVIDERFNQGGYAADYIVELLGRELMGYFNNPVDDKQPFTSPGFGLFGPKVMIINEMAGSGGDYMPYMFSKRKIGPLIGTRTWGGLVGIWDVPPLLDGGRITAPRGGFYSTEGEWRVENEGVAPDIMVEQDPALVQKGKDPQLERAVEEALRLLETQEVKLLPQPADPVRSLRPKG